MKTVKQITILLLIFAMSGIAAASTIQKIDVILGFGLFSRFETPPGTQTLTSTNGALVFFSEPGVDPLSFSHTQLSATFNGVTDRSNGGLASATFSSGVWQVRLFSPTDPSHLVFDISGTVDWYREDESQQLTNTVNGVGKVTLTNVAFVDPAFWQGATWGSTDNKSAVTTTITGATQGGGNLVNYQTNWQSDNVTMVVWADSSMAVPEPATMLILSLGGLLLRKRA